MPGSGAPEARKRLAHGVSRGANRRKQAKHQRCGRMSHSYSQNVVHLVFSTKGRVASISNKFQPDLWAYIAAICQRQGMFVHVIGGMPDHIHLLLQIPSTMSLAKCVAHDQGQFVEVGRRKRPQIFVAKRLCGVQCQRIGCVSGGAVHQESGGASQEDEFCRGICGVVEEARWRTTEICVGVRIAETERVKRRGSVAPTVLAFFSMRTHPLRGGLTSAAPPALDWR